MATKPLLQWGAICLIGLVYMICWATFGNGVSIGWAAILVKLRKTRWGSPTAISTSSVVGDGATPGYLRITNRGAWPPYGHTRDMGFRIARMPR
jgi:hypothetical protein